MTTVVAVSMHISIEGGRGWQLAMLKEVELRWLREQHVL